MNKLFRFLSIALIVLLTGCGTIKLSRTERRHIPAPMQGVPEQIITKKGYTTSYNDNTLQPNWVFWRLIADHVNGEVARPGNAYHEEKKVAKPRATLADYRRSGFSRGHMCPAADNKWDRQAMHDTYSLINICPQTERCNSGVWNSIEMQCREWALEYGELYIVCGPIFRSRPETIGPNNVAVPDAFFKVVVCLNGKKKGIGFICDNVDRNQTMKKCVVTIDEIERITGIDFFPHFTAYERHAVEDRANLKDW